MFKKGDLVRVREDALYGFYASTNKRMTQAHGYLWVVIDPTTFHLRSLATGKVSDNWLMSELEKADVQEG